MRDVISMSDFTREEILAVLDVADDVLNARQDPASHSREFRRKYGKDLNELLENVFLANLFLENSTRTNFSFRTAALTTRAFVEGFSSPDDTSLGKGETWADTSAMFAGLGYNGIVMRSTIEGLPRWTKETLTKDNQHLAELHTEFCLPFSYHTPIIFNGGDGKNQHPTQCFLDLFTMRQIARAKGRDLDNLDLALTNDLKYGRTIASLMSIAHHFNFKLHFAYPGRFGPQKHRLEDLTHRGVEYVDHKENFVEAMKSSFITYHSRPQKERVGAGEDLMTIKTLGRITRTMYDQLGKQGPYLMHPLPIDSKTFEEIYHDMNRHPKNVTKLQAENGLYVRIALLALGLDRITVQGYEPTKQAEYQRVRLEELPLSTTTKERAPNPRTGHIEGDGVVLDHIPRGMKRRLEGVLGFEQREDRDETFTVVGGTNITATGGRKERKDMLKVHNEYDFSPEQWEAMALIAPDITVSYVKSGRVVRKVRPVLGNYIEGRVKCANNACVTNVPEEHVISAHHIENRYDQNDDQTLRCHFCEQTDTIGRIYRDQRFSYIGQEQT